MVVVSGQEYLGLNSTNGILLCFSETPDWARKLLERDVTIVTLFFQLFDGQSKVQLLTG